MAKVSRSLAARSVLDQATASYQEILQNYTTSPLLPSALIGQAAVHEATGKRSEAMKLYEFIVKEYSKNFQAPQAQFAIGKLCETGGQFKEAQKAYEDLIANYPKSAWKVDAEENLRKVNFLLKGKPADVANTAVKEVKEIKVPPLSVTPNKK